MSAETAEVETPTIDDEQQTEAETPNEPSPSENGETPSEGGEQQAPEAEAKPPEVADDVEIHIGDSPIPKTEPAPEWVRELRKQHREAQRRIRELEAERAAVKPAAEAVPVLGKEPTLADVDYDEDKFKRAVFDWHDRKRKIEEAQARAEAEAKKQQEVWQRKLTAYSEGKAKLAIPDFDEAESVVQDTLSQTQQSILLHGCENAALVVAALGKAPAKAKELAAITDPVSFAFAVAKLESQIKMTKQTKAPPPPEKKISGTGSSSGAVDSTLERLRAEAEKTGDYSKVVAFKRQQQKGK